MRTSAGSQKVETRPETDPVAVGLHRPQGRAPLVLVCEHASAEIPARYRGLGLPEAEIQRHIGWDIGALAVARHLADAFDASLVYATQSRLLMDLNRAPEAHDAIVTRSEDTEIPGNQGLDAAERAFRRQWLYEPFHRTLAAQLDHVELRGQAPVLVSIHSFTPSFRGVARPWQLGVLYAAERRLAERLLPRLKADPTLCVGDNQPYAPVDGVCHTMDLHATPRGLRCLMLEIRNDLITSAAGQQQWAARLETELRWLLD